MKEIKGSPIEEVIAQHEKLDRIFVSIPSIPEASGKIQDIAEALGLSYEQVCTTPLEALASRVNKEELLRLYQVITSYLHALHVYADELEHALTETDITSRNTDAWRYYISILERRDQIQALQKRNEIYLAANNGTDKSA